MVEVPDKQCDLVMKGGITSGVVYPRAIRRITQDYRLLNIGGTSAGAIAAVVAAARENRRQGGSPKSRGPPPAALGPLQGGYGQDTAPRPLPGALRGDSRGAPRPR